MKRSFAAIAASLAAFALPHAFAQTETQTAAQTAARPRSCRGTSLTGTIRDSTLALIPGAKLVLDNSATLSLDHAARSATSGSDGQFVFPCVANGPHHLTITAVGFAQLDRSVTAPHAAPLSLILNLENVQTQVSVTAGNGAATNPNSSGPNQTISGSRLQSLADDPDDLLRELQQMSAAAGGSPSNVVIAVDGFQGSSALPPKSSIAYIKVNPDLFSAEYREPPFRGGRVEVYTKPGQKAYHGAIFTTNGSSWENARDPFSVSKGAIGKQRYGFELTGPVRPHLRNGAGSDFSLTLEHRIINNVDVVDAVTFDSAANPITTIATVAAPQSLWLATARLDWQLGAKNTFIATYSANVNHLQNVGVGGTNLADTGYNSETYEHMVRLSDITLFSTRAMHEARLSLRWDGSTFTPLSTAPQVQVEGAFTSGGANLGAQQLHEFNVEYDDDAILTPKHHTIKFGTQLMLYNEHQQLPTSFNGTYTFGGGTAPVLDAGNNPIPGETETITGVQQYQRALLNLPGGTATAFTNVAGTPTVDFTQIQDALYFQDDWNPGHRIHVVYGVRYFIQNDPTVLDSIVPRAGILWSPDKKGKTTLHAHAGMFSGYFGESDEAEVRREDGTNRVTSTIYNPVYNNPFSGATVIHSVREFSPHISNITWQAENVGGTHAFPGGWNFSADYYLGRFWNYARTENINSPLNDSPTGPRPGPADLDVLQVQNSGQGRVNVTFLGVEQHALKHLQMYLGGARVEIIDDTDDNYFFTPQSSRTNAGEFAHRTAQPIWNVFANGTFTFPEKIQLSGNLYAGGDAHYDITTGFDNNGDGDFNDRPAYAAPGTPGAISTPYGLLTNDTVNGDFPRNKGVMPWTIYLDANLQRAFKLTRNPKAEHQQTLTVNLRSSNLLNHTNVTSVGGVLGSPLFGVPYAADNGRRIEAGLRYSF